MQVAISTTERKEPYIQTTLKTLFSGAGDAALAVRCVVHGASDSYLGAWRDDERIVTETLTRTRTRALGRRGKKQRIFHNTLRCLRGADHEQGLLYCQDDVEFCKGWHDKLSIMRDVAPRYLKNHMKVVHPDRYVLALYASYPFKNKPVAPYPTQRFYGNQCVFFPRSVVGDVFHAMRHSFTSGRCPPDDIWLKEWCMSTDTPILCGIPNLVQHIGIDSSSESPFHTSPTFETGEKS